jgi:hypothetical protein
MRLINKQFRKTHADIRCILKHKKQGTGELYWGTISRGIGAKEALQERKRR